MKDLTCLNTIITDNLAIHIDLTNLKSWDLNTGYTSISLSKWGSAVSDNIFLYDFGLTAYDNGRVNKMYDTLSLTPSDNKVTLYRIGYNNATGGTFYTLLGITGVTGTTIGTGLTATTLPPAVGRYFKVDGGYLQGFYKLKGFNYELVPSRFASGVTIESLMYISGTSFNDGYFYFMGQRAEDKYIKNFSGESTNYSNSKLTFSGVTTSTGNYLNNFITTQQLKKAINDQNQFQSGYTQIDDKGINENVIGFYISTDKRIGYTRINEKGIVENNLSDNQLNTGWTLITIVFKPYDIITDKSLLCCTDRRLGDFLIYVNGRRFWKIENYNEFYFRSTLNTKEKQEGLPYNISWGGGSFGLKNSYHYDTNIRVVFDSNTSTTGTSGHSSVFTTGFTLTNIPFFTGDCTPQSLAPYNAQIIVTGDNKTFYSIDSCSGMTAMTSVLKLNNKTVQLTGTTPTISGKTANQYYLKYNKTFQLLSNRDYIFEFDVFDDQVFPFYSTANIGMIFSGETPITILESRIYQYNALTASTKIWYKVRYKIRTQDNTGLSNVNLYLFINCSSALNIGFQLFFKNFIFWGSDKLSKDHTKDNGLIEQTYSKSFVGAIQKLRLYDIAFNSQQILHNANIEFSNIAYGVTLNQGGRIIHR